MMTLRTRSRLLICSVLAILAALALCSSAGAATLADKRAQAAAVQAQIDDLNTKAEIASENYNTAHSRYDRLTLQVSSSGRQIAKLQARTKQLQTHLNTRANDMYRQGPAAFLSVLLSVRTFEDFDTTLRVLTSLNQDDAQTVSQLRQTKQAAETARATLISARAQAGRQQVAMASSAQSVKSQLAARTRVLGGLSTDIKTLLAQQQDADAAAARAQYAALVAQQAADARAAKARQVIYQPPAPHTPGKSAPNNQPKRAASPKARPHSSGGGAPASSSGGAGAVYWAQKALGKPYVWAASGPNSFDCSGLTMWAYRHVGVSLPHSSQEQIGSGSRVSKSNLQPGDLVFFGSPIHHVAMYVGHGDMIEAPYTGADVRVTSLGRRSDYAGACRPR